MSFGGWRGLPPNRPPMNFAAQPMAYFGNYGLQDNQVGPMRPDHTWRRGRGQAVRGPMAARAPFWGPSRGRARPPPPPPHARGILPPPWHRPPIADRYSEFRAYEQFAPFFKAQDTTPSSLNTLPSKVDRDVQASWRSYSNFVDFGTTHQTLDWKFEISARNIDISWTPPDVAVGVRYTYWLNVDGDKDLFNFEMPWHKTRHSIRTTPGAVYKVTLSCRSQEGRLLAQSQKEVKAVFSLAELKKLHHRAVEVNGNETHSFRWLYRCKPERYWQDIYTNCHGIMEPYAKDNNGQPANAINGAISGLFFSARLFNGVMSGTSPFGDRRFRIEAPFLLDDSKHTMYFADFYCNTALHYVTIVVCIRDSPTDIYCSTRLIRLNPATNPFIRVQYYPPSKNLPDGGQEYFVNKNVWVEVFYAGSVDINRRPLDPIQATGMGTSRIGGLPNNKYCEICNLYPVAKPGSATEKGSEKECHYTDPRESTIVLCNSLTDVKKELGDLWPDAVDTVCHLVNQTCEMMENDFGVADAQQRSAERMDNAMAVLQREIEKCQDVEILAFAEDLRQVVSSFKMQRKVVMDLLNKKSQEIDVTTDISQRKIAAATRKR